MLRTRLITGLTAIPLVFFIVYMGGLWVLGGALIVALIAGWEFIQMMRAGGYQPGPLYLLGFITLLLWDCYTWPQNHLQYILSLVVLPSLIWQLFVKQTETPIADWALTLAGALYIGWGMGHLVALRQLADGQAWIWLTLWVTWGADTCAYLVGRKFGAHKIWPRHSPKKTWEGFGGGILGGVLASVLVNLLFYGTFTWITVFAVGCIVPIVAFFGDICESMMKRNAGVKDASNYFPGHGGFLDRIDSLLFVSVAVYYYALWLA